MTGPGEGDNLDAPTDEAFRFDFATFEQTEQEIRAATPAPAPRVAAPPADRVIAARSVVPAGDAAVETRVIDGVTVIAVRGRINESFRGAEIGRSLRGTVVFDLSQVDRVTSFGVRGWLQMLDETAADRLLYYRCSEAVVNQITMMRSFCGRGQIHSLVAPYACHACGHEFGAVFDAIEDRSRLLGRSAPPVGCPACGAAAEIAEDPFVVLALDAHLADAIPDDVARAIERHAADQRVDPVEQFVSAGETRVRFHAPLLPTARLERVFAGLEGRVILDFSLCPPAEGVEDLLFAAWGDLDPAIHELGVDGCTATLAARWLRERPERVFVKSLFCEAVSVASGVQRKVLVDIERRQARLAAGVLPPLAAAWAGGPNVLPAPELLFAVARARAPTDAAPRPATEFPAGVAEQVAFTHIAPAFVPPAAAAPGAPTAGAPIPSAPPAGPPRVPLSPAWVALAAALVVAALVWAVVRT